MSSSADDRIRSIAPGPAGNPITTQLRPFEADPLGFLLRARQEYGDVVRLRLWPQLYHLVCHPDGIRHVLITRADNYHGASGPRRGGRSGSAAEPLGVEAVLARHRSRLAQRLFHRQSLVPYAAPIAAATERMLARWRLAADAAEPLDIMPEITPLTLAILGETLFNPGQGDELAAIAPALTFALAHAAPHGSVSVLQRLQRAAAPANPELEDALATVYRLIDRLIDERRRSGEDTGDLLSLLALSPDPIGGETLPDEPLRETMIVFLIAGHTTIASALAWTLYLLASYPEAQRRVRHEVDHVLGERPPTAADLTSLRYSAMALQESLRLYPPAPIFVPRMALAPDQIQGYEIPAGSLVLISPWVTHRHPAFWENPEAFLPERFAGPTSPAYLPFGSGPWGCIGSPFGLLEAGLVLAMIARRFAWELVPGHPVEPLPGVSLKPRYGLPLILHNRGGRA